MTDRLRDDVKCLSGGHGCKNLECFRENSLGFCRVNLRFFRINLAGHLILQIMAVFASVSKSVVDTRDQDLINPDQANNPETGANPFCVDSTHIKFMTPGFCMSLDFNTGN